MAHAAGDPGFIDWVNATDSTVAGKVDKAANLSDLANAATARTNLGLGGAAVLPVGTTAGTVAAGDDSRITGALSAATASGTYGPRRSVFVKTYLTDGATATQNAAAINTAMAAAVAGGYDLCFDGVTCSIDAEINITATGLRAWSSTPAACTITQTVMGQGVFYVKANGVTVDGFTLVGTLIDNGTTLDMQGWTLDPHLVSAIKVAAGTATPTVKRIVGSRWFGVLIGFPYNINTTGYAETSADPATYQFITGATASDISVSSVWCAVRMSGLMNADFGNVSGTYKPVSNTAPAAGIVDASTSPPHLFYISMPTISTDTPKAWNVDVKVHDCHGQGGRGGAPFSLRYIKGLTWSDLTADDCEGLVDMIGVHGFQGSGGHSTRDCYPRSNAWNGNRGSLALTYCQDGLVNPAVLEGADSFDHGSLVYVGACKDVKVREPKGWITNATADNGGRISYLSGTNVWVDRPDFDSRGAVMAVAALLASGINNDSTVTLNDPAFRGGANLLRGVDLVTTTTKQTIIYDPAKIVVANQVIMFPTDMTAASAPILVNTRYGYPPSTSQRVIGWNHGEKLANSSVFRTWWPSGQPSSVVTDAWVPATPYINANGTVTGILCADFGAVNVDVSCDVKYASGAGKVGLALRAIDTNNFLEVYINSTSVILAKRVAGTYTTLATAALTVATPGTWHELRVRAIGAQVVAYLNGVQVISYTLTGGDDTTFGTATSHGLRSDNGGANSAWYGFRIKAA